MLYTRPRTAWSPTSASSTCAPITKATGVTVDDVAKRLIDYGFHAPTMCFPVAGTLMVEPTESEDLARARPLLRRDDRDPRRDRPRSRRASGRPTTTRCANAPHTAETAGAASGRTRTRASEAGVPGRRRCGRTKYWPPVRRIDGAYGDRNLVCSCPPVTEYATAEA